MNYHNITYPDMNNGDGLRVVLWLSGCSHHCKGCQNPQTWNSDSGIIFDEVAKNELFEELGKDYISGLTLTGGDPLNSKNLDGVLSIINTFRQKFGASKTIWLYSGYTWEDIWSDSNIVDEETLKVYEENKKRRAIIMLSNVFVDGRYVEDKRDITLKWRGSSNQRVIDIQKSIEQDTIVLHCD